MFDYIRDPDEIYRQSFATLRTETDLSSLPAGIDILVERMIHACGMPDIIDDFVFGANPASAGRDALRSGAPVIVDAEMVSAGIIKSRLPNDNALICTTHSSKALMAAQEHRMTRSAAGVDQWEPYLPGAVVVIGNAPTALFRLLELLAQGVGAPAVILGFPVGFIGAAESKEALIRNAGLVPYATIRGRRGGSAIASAAINAISGLTL